jgi:hypothetical protein
MVKTSWQKLHRIILKHINPDHPRQPDIKETQHQDYCGNDWNDLHIESFIKEPACDQVGNDSLSNCQSVIDKHCPEEITGFLFKLKMAMAAMLVHLRETEAEEETFVTEYFSLVTIRTFILKNMIQ